MPDARLPSFYQVVSAAVAHFTEHGYVSDEDLETWIATIRAAALRDLVPESVMERALRASLGAIYARLIDRGGLLAHHPEVGRFTLRQVKPKLRAELSRRVMASANLIKLNREAAIDATLHRFAGWATSVPPGGTPGQRRGVSRDIRRDLTGLSFRERRVNIDQGHKLAANLSEILALDGGAIAGVWHQHHTNNPRREHTARDGRIYLVRDNWAQRRSLVRPGPAGYTDEVTKPAEEVFCRCTYTWVYTLRQLPVTMLTAKGRAELARVMQEERKAA